MKQIQIIIRQYSPNAVILCYDDIYPEEIIKGKLYIISNFPDNVHKSIIDYIDCYYSIVKQDNFSVTFKSI